MPVPPSIPPCIQGNRKMRAILLISLLSFTACCFTATSILLSFRNDVMGYRFMVDENAPMMVVQRAKHLSSTSFKRKAVISNNVTNFRLDQYDFLSQLTDCMDDRDCRILYLHFGKSGGSGLEVRMFRLFPPYLDGFANGSILERFKERTSEYCNAKFSSYQVSGSEFVETIVPTCMNVTKSRAVIMVSFREPIQRSLSYIHQQCNKNLRKRSRVIRQACSRCSYERDKEFWDKKVEFFNQEYKELLEVTSTKFKNTTVLSVDSADLTLLYEKLFEATKHEAFLQSSRKANEEKTDKCNFGLKSEMLRKLAPSSDIYRNLTLGMHG